MKKSAMGMLYQKRHDGIMMLRILFISVVRGSFAVDIMQMRMILVFSLYQQPLVDRLLIMLLVL